MTYTPPPFSTPPPQDMTPSDNVQQKDRHGCLTAYLVVAMLLTVLGAIAVFTLAFFISILESNLEGPELTQFQEDTAALPGSGGAAVIGLVGLLDLVGLTGLWLWKKWGFWTLLGLNALSLVTVVLFYSPVLLPFNLIQSAISIGILYGVLHIGDRNKGWAQLD